jgi:mRNA-degrading endonuclease RelE of RelBE toxin-antitoxin system
MLTLERYNVSLSLRALRETRRLDRQILARIAKAIDSLVENPSPSWMS